MRGSFVCAILKAGARGGKRSIPVAPNVRQRDTSGAELLFVSDAGTNDVYIFTLPNLKLRKTIHGFDQPYHLRAGPGGDVWVPDLANSKLFRYDRRGRRLEAIPFSYFGYPTACAVSSTGLLAVLGGSSNGVGGIVLYFALEVPLKLKVPGISNYFFDSFDSKGNLFVDGTDSGSNFELGVVPAGKRKGHLITVTGGTINSAGFVQWYSPGNYLAVADENCGSGNACIYSVKISGSKGTITGKTDLLSPSGGANCGLYQAAIDPATGNDIVGNLQGCSSYASVNRWAYPAGGTPTNSLQNFVKVPIGAAISTE